MPEYVLDHHQRGEGRRLALMSRLLDPMHRRYLEQLGVGPGDHTLEAGCGNGSISAWLAQQTAPGGHAVAVDLDLSLVGPAVPGLAGLVAGSRSIDSFLAQCTDPAWWTPDHSLHRHARLQAGVRTAPAPRGAAGVRSSPHRPVTPSGLQATVDPRAGRSCSW